MCVVNFRIISCVPFFLAGFSHLTCFLRLIDLSRIVCSRLYKLWPALLCTYHRRYEQVCAGVHFLQSGALHSTYVFFSSGVFHQNHVRVVYRGGWCDRCTKMKTTKLHTDLLGSQKGESILHWPVEQSVKCFLWVRVTSGRKVTKQEQYKVMMTLNEMELSTAPWGTKMSILARKKSDNWIWTWKLRSLRKLDTQQSS